MLHLGKQKIKGKVGKPKIVSDRLCERVSLLTVTQEYTGKRGRPKKPKTVAQLEALRVKKCAPVVPLAVKQARRSAKAQAAKNLASSVEHCTTRSASKRQRAMCELVNSGANRNILIFLLATLDINSPT